MSFLTSWLQSPSAVILEPKKIKSISIVSPSICHEVTGPDAMILEARVFTLLFHLHQGDFSSPSLSAIRVVSPVYLIFFFVFRFIVLGNIVRFHTL